MSAADRIRSHSRINSSSTPQTWELDETLMYGSYSRDLSMHARVQAREARLKKRREISKGFYNRTSSYTQSCSRLFKQFRYHIIAKVGEDWIFLTILGVVMALLSFLMDFIIGKCQYARMWLYASTAQWVPLQFTLWVMFPIVLVCFSSGFVHLVGPNAIGSGIPEMKTILRGVVLKEYLTARTLVAKIVGLCTSLGCGLPIGKEGPFVHVASIAATLLGKFVTSVTGIYENESRTHEMLAAACAVGVACTFAAPIGGVLFSIEVTSSFFAVKNYWRGFYSAVCGALVFRLLAIVFHREETITALFKTNLRQDFPFDPAELLAFAIIGIVCGFAGALFVYTHRCFVMFIRGHTRMKAFLQKNRFIFPATVMFIIAGTIYPPGLGQYMAGQLTNGEALNELFTNVTWSDPRAYMDVAEKEVLDHWSGPHENVFLTLTCFIIMRFFATAMATALPVPSGVFMPIFTIGAAFGRLMGESMSVWFPSGIGGQHIVPGGYAIVGAAALSGSVTHTISTAVIVFEITGQIAHVLPCVIAVLLSNAVAHTMQPSFYDSIIRIKKLPYLPDIVNTTIVNAHRIFVEDIMIKDVVLITSNSTIREVNHILESFSFKAFPFVDGKDSRILLGSIERYELESAVDEALSSKAKLDYLQSFPRVGEFLHGNTLTVPGAKPPKPPMAPKAPLAQIKVPDELSPSPLSAPSTSVSSRFAVFAVQEPDKESDNEYEEEDGSYSGADLTDHNDTVTDKPKRSILKTKQQSGKQKVARFDTVKTPLKVSEITPAMEALWLEHQMQVPLLFEKCHIDPAPFQLVERTSLFKIHSLFSLLSLHHAYVTNMGRLVGIVSLKEVRNAIQGEVNGSGVLLHERKVSLVPPVAVNVEGVAVDCESGTATYQK